jgi:hypothetical protein
LTVIYLGRDRPPLPVGSLCPVIPVLSLATVQFSRSAERANPPPTARDRVQRAAGASRSLKTQQHASHLAGELRGAQRVWPAGSVDMLVPIALEDVQVQALALEKRASSLSGAAEPKLRRRSCWRSVPSDLKRAP